MASLPDRLDGVKKKVQWVIKHGHTEKYPGLSKSFVTLLDKLDRTAEQLHDVMLQDSASTVFYETKTSEASVAGTARIGVLESAEALIKKGELVDPPAFQKLMGWTTRQAVWKAASSHRVFYLTYKAERYFPVFYADTAYDRKHLEEVTKILGDLPGGSKLQFFLTRKGSLAGLSPLQALAAGQIEKVKNTASAFAEVTTEA